MAVVTIPLKPGKIPQLRGMVDVYEWKGLVVARAWPRPPHQPNSPEQLAARAAFSSTFPWLRARSAYWHQQFDRYAVPDSIAPAQIKMKFALRLAYASLLIDPPPVTGVDYNFHSPSKTGYMTLSVSSFEGWSPDAFAWYATCKADAWPRGEWKREMRTCRIHMTPIWKYGLAYPVPWPGVIRSLSSDPPAVKLQIPDATPYACAWICPGGAPDSTYPLTHFLLPISPTGGLPY